MRAKRLRPMLLMIAFVGALIGLGVGLGLLMYWFIITATKAYLGDWSLPPG